MAKQLWDPVKEEYRWVAGDPVGGIRTGMKNKPYASPQIRYRDMLIECELYKDPGTDELTLHAMCPRCCHAIWIREKNKAIEWNGQTISIEAFECPWELDDKLTVGTFTNLCRWRVAVDHGIAKDA